MTNTISTEEMWGICRAGQGADCCRYIAASVKGIECLKHTDLATTVDARVEAGAFIARGDNCEGKH